MPKPSAPDSPALRDCGPLCISQVTREARYEVDSSDCGNGGGDFGGRQGTRADRSHGRRNLPHGQSGPRYPQCESGRRLEARPPARAGGSVGGPSRVPARPRSSSNASPRRPSCSTIVMPNSLRPSWQEPRRAPIRSPTGWRAGSGSSRSMRSTRTRVPANPTISRSTRSSPGRRRTMRRAGWTRSWARGRPP